MRPDGNQFCPHSPPAINYMQAPLRNAISTLFPEKLRRWGDSRNSDNMRGFLPKYAHSFVNVSFLPAMNLKNEIAHRSDPRFMSIDHIPV